MTDKPLVGGDAAGNVQGPVSRRALVAGSPVPSARRWPLRWAPQRWPRRPAPALLSQDNTGPNAHRTAIFVPNNTEVASLGDSVRRFTACFWGLRRRRHVRCTRRRCRGWCDRGARNGSGDGAGVSGSGGPDGGFGVSGLGSLTAAAWPASAARTASPAAPECSEVATPRTVPASSVMASGRAPASSAQAPRRRPVSILRSAVLPATDGTNGVRSTR